MTRHSLLFFPFLGVAILLLAGCQPAKSPSSTASPTAPEQSPKTGPPPLSGYPHGDTVDWRSVAEFYRPLAAHPGARELPGQRLGLTGPIIARGGSGSDAYIAVYDPAGVLVGRLLERDAEDNPEMFRQILHKALLRSELQNGFALEQMRRNGALDR